MWRGWMVAVIKSARLGRYARGASPWAAAGVWALPKLSVPRVTAPDSSVASAAFLGMWFGPVLCSDAARSRRHEFRADWIGNRFAQNPMDLISGGGIQPPAGNLADWLQLRWMTGPPQCHRDSLVEHPADRQMNDAFAETSQGELIEALHRVEILREPRLEKFGVAETQIVAVERRKRLHPPGQQAAAQGAVAQCRDLVVTAIRQKVGLDAAFEQVIGRLE